MNPGSFSVNFPRLLGLNPRSGNRCGQSKMVEAAMCDRDTPPGPILTSLSMGTEVANHVHAPAPFTALRATSTFLSPMVVPFPTSGRRGHVI